LEQDTASTQSLVDGLISGDSNIALVTPAGTPRVLDSESFNTIDLFIANSQNGMVNSSTTSRSDNTRLVESESAFISSNGDGNGAGNQSSLELFRVLGSDDLDTRVSLNSLGRVILAFAILSSIGIVSFEFETVVGGIGNSLLGPATIATLSSELSAINDLLFSERKEFSILDEVEAFNDTSSGESPARAALALVLDGSNGTLGSPINRFRESAINGGSNDFFRVGRFNEGSACVDSREFSIG